MSNQLISLVGSDLCTENRIDRNLRNEIFRGLHFGGDHRRLNKC